MKNFLAFLLLAGICINLNASNDRYLVVEEKNIAPGALACDCCEENCTNARDLDEKPSDHFACKDCK